MLSIGAMPVDEAGRPVGAPAPWLPHYATCRQIGLLSGAAAGRAAKLGANDCRGEHFGPLRECLATLADTNFGYFSHLVGGSAWKTSGNRGPLGRYLCRNGERCLLASLMRGQLRRGHSRSRGWLRPALHIVDSAQRRFFTARTSSFPFSQLPSKARGHSA